MAAAGFARSFAAAVVFFLLVRTAVSVEAGTNVQQQNPPTRRPRCDGDDPTPKLPVFFFHGVTANASSAEHYARNLSAAGYRVFPLEFCTGRCSVQAIVTQIPLAIAELRRITSASPEVFEDGYIFIGHSQGGAIARAVIEEWDEHRVRRFISLAGAQNGAFYGPQPADRLPLHVFLKSLGPALTPPNLFDFSRYDNTSSWRGLFQFELAEAMLDHPEGHSTISGFNLARSPAHDRWAATNPFLPVINNVNPCSDDSCKLAQRRRRENFLRLERADFFASPDDQVIAPWQGSIFGQYNDVDDVRQIETDFEAFRILEMKETREYREDTFGLQTLDRRGALHLHVVPGITHNCWIKDTLALVTNAPCSFQKVYDEHVLPVIA